MNALWTDSATDRPIPLFAALRNDLIAHIPAERRGGPWLARLVRGLSVVVTSSGFRLTWNYRLSHMARGRWGVPGRVVSAFLYWWGRRFYGCSIAPTARIHGGLILPHPQGIVIGAGAVVGPWTWIFQNVTIGGAPGRAGLPRVGSDARIYAGAVLSGPITVGDNVMIGANATVYRDLPSRTVARAATIEVSPLPDRFRCDPDDPPPST